MHEQEEGANMTRWGGGEISAAAAEGGVRKSRFGIPVGHIVGDPDQQDLAGFEWVGSYSFVTECHLFVSRIAAEEEARRIAAEEEEAKRIAAEEEAKRIAAEEEARRIAAAEAAAAAAEAAAAEASNMVDLTHSPAATLSAGNWLESFAARTSTSSAAFTSGSSTVDEQPFGAQYDADPSKYGMILRNVVPHEDLARSREEFQGAWTGPTGDGQHLWFAPKPQGRKGVRINGAHDARLSSRRRDRLVLAEAAGRKETPASGSTRGRCTTTNAKSLHIKRQS
ncbi:hypothetical protein RI054_23g98880 [Pseudoscourfieldia marina]